MERVRPDAAPLTPRLALRGGRLSAYRILSGVPDLFLGRLWALRPVCRPREPLRGCAYPAGVPRADCDSPIARLALRGGALLGLRLLSCTATVCGDASWPSSRSANCSVRRTTREKVISIIALDPASSCPPVVFAFVLIACSTSSCSFSSCRTAQASICFPPPPPGLSTSAAGCIDSMSALA